MGEEGGNCSAREGQDLEMAVEGEVWVQHLEGEEEGQSPSQEEGDRRPGQEGKQSPSQEAGKSPSQDRGQEAVRERLAREGPLLPMQEKPLQHRAQHVRARREDHLRQSASGRSRG